MHRAIGKRSQRIDDLEFQLRRLSKLAVDNGCRKLDDLKRRLQAADLRLKFARNRHTLELLHQRLDKTMQTNINRAARRLDDCQLHLRQLSPLTVLGRGYAIVEDSRGRVLRSAEETAAGALVKIRLHEGRLEAEVK